MNIKHILMTGAAVVSLALNSAYAWEPDSDVTMIVAYKQGSGTDIGARVLAHASQKYMKHRLVIKNIYGEDPAQGWKELINAAPDGKTLGFVNLPTFITYTLPPFNTFSVEDITPICNHLTETEVVVVRKDSKYTTLKELVDDAKAHGDFMVSTNGAKASNHTAAQLLAKTAEFSYIPVDYDGTADQLNALEKGEVDFSCAKLADVSNRISEPYPVFKVLGVFSDERIKKLKDVPTLNEFGYYGNWYGSSRGIAGPKGLSEEIVKYYEDLFMKILQDPEVIQQHYTMNLSIDYKDHFNYEATILASKYLCSDIIPMIFESSDGEENSQEKQGN